MNIERAFERRAALLARIDRLLKFGMFLPRETNNPKTCKEAVYGEHGAPNWRGRCPYCDKYLVTRSRLNTESSLERNDVFKLPRGSRVRTEIEHLRTFGENTDDYRL